MTNQNQNGEPKSSVETKVEELEQVTKDYLESLKLTVKNVGKGGEYLNITEEVLGQLSGEACAEIAFSLAQYGLYIQQVINKHKALFNWAERNIMGIIAPDINNQGSQYTPYEVKKMLSIRENPAAKELYVLRGLTENNLTVLQELPRRIDLMVGTLKELSMHRRKQQ